MIDVMERKFIFLQACDLVWNVRNIAFVLIAADVCRLESTGRNISASRDNLRARPEFRPEFSRDSMYEKQADNYDKA